MRRSQGPCVSVFRAVIHALGELGLEWSPLFEACGIDPESIRDPEGRVPMPVYDRFWPRLAEITGDPCFGLHLAHRIRPIAGNLNGYLLMSSPSVRDGLERVARFQRIVFATDWISLEPRGTSLFVHLEFPEIDPVNRQVETEYKTVLISRCLDWITDADFHPTEVYFRHAPEGDVPEYERVLCCPTKFRTQESGLLISQASLSQPSLHANPELANLHHDYMEKLLDTIEDHSATRRVQTLLLSLLDRGPCELSELARTLHVSSRTLQRRLTEEGSSYKQILDDLRKGVCLEHLARPDVSLAEIAYIAGFSDTSAFTRAVRRWTGAMPSVYRRLRVREGSA